MPDVVVVGGGIAGLAAARDLALTGREVLLLEASPRPGGKLLTAQVAGLGVDVGAEAMLNRRPEGVALAGEMGLDLVHPTGASSRILSRGVLRRMPRTLMGVPFDVDDVESSAILSAEGMARLRAEVVPADPPGEDVSIGDLLSERFGEEVVQRLTEPLLGGVYAGHAHDLSTAASVPALVPMLARGGSLLDQVAALPTSAAPVFASLVGGMGSWPERFAAEGLVEIRTSATVRELRRDGARWALTVGPTTAAYTVHADQVVLAAPAAPTARLLAEVAPEASAALARTEVASVGVLTFAFRAADLPDWAEDVSGFLVPPVEGRAIKASTFSFAKWAWVKALDPDLRVLRTSVGRHGDVGALQRTDADLLAESRAELADLVGITGAPVDTHVQRWGGGLPQYPVGHLERVAAARAALPAGLAVCGASYDGVGIPAVIGAARRAAAALAGR
ncbi:MAG: protoporphyrinogen oxidase [Nocardioides sp.]|uniref:protoporphyrinogen oxidase n=1 Tax=Nocardioides sp. TaxID=35761 RepID=UPI003F0A96E3